MYFALGFLVAGLFTLMFLPAFWRRAMRLSMRRLRMLAPMSMEEVVAERDLLRAEFAIRERRLEQDVASVKAARARDLVDNGRFAERIADLEGRLKRAEAYSRDVDLQLREANKTLEARTELLSSTEMALHEMTERAERGVETLRHLEIDKAELGREAEARQSRVMAHEAKIASLHNEYSEMQRELEQLRDAYAGASREAERLPSLEAELARAAGGLDAMRSANQSLELTLDETRKSLAALKERHAEDVEQLENGVRVARGEAKDYADRLETARADNAMLQGAVEALRKEHARLREAETASVRAEDTAWRAARAPAKGNGGDAALNDADVAALRRAISDMGARMAEISADASEKMSQVN